MGCSKNFEINRTGKVWIRHCEELYEIADLVEDSEGKRGFGKVDEEDEKIKVFSPSKQKELYLPPEEVWTFEADHLGENDDLSLLSSFSEGPLLFKYNIVNESFHPFLF